MSGLLLFVILAVTAAAASGDETAFSAGFRTIRRLYDQCDSKSDIWKCLKLQTLKVADRALQSRSFGLFEGVSVVSNGDPSGRSFRALPLDSEKLEALSSGQIDGLIFETLMRFLDTHSLEVNVPKLVEEGRGKKGKEYMGPLLALMAIKGSFLAMAYKGIAAMAGTALIVGKIALVLSAVLGLKKLLSSGSEKTTFEIVKIPHHSQSHTYSSSYEDDGHYHRSMSPEEYNNLQQRAYRGYKYGS